MGFGGFFCFLRKEGIYKKSTKHAISFSGGKDSTALLLRMLEEKMPVDVILFCEGKRIRQIVSDLSAHFAL